MSRIELSKRYRKFRDENGRFISQQKAENRGISGQYYYSYSVDGETGSVRAGSRKQARKKIGEPEEPKKFRPRFSWDCRQATYGRWSGIDCEGKVEAWYIDLPDEFNETKFSSDIFNYDLWRERIEEKAKSELQLNGYTKGYILFDLIFYSGGGLIQQSRKIRGKDQDDSDGILQSFDDILGQLEAKLSQSPIHIYIVNLYMVFLK